MNRDQDAEVVELIYKWKYASIGKDYDGNNECKILAPNGELPEGFCPPMKGVIHKGFLAPSFSNDRMTAINLAIKVSLPMYLHAMPHDDPEELTRICLEHFKSSNSVNGLYLKAKYKVEEGVYLLDDMKVEHIDSSGDFITGLFLISTNNPSDNFWESARKFLQRRPERVF